MQFGKGDEFEDHGQHFECIGTEPYTSKVGKAVVLAVWRARCATCGVFFRFKSPVKVRGATIQLRRRCDRHKQPGVPSFPKPPRWGKRAAPPISLFE